MHQAAEVHTAQWLTYIYPGDKCMIEKITEGRRLLGQLSILPVQDELGEALLVAILERIDLVLLRVRGEDDLDLLGRFC